MALHQLVKVGVPLAPGVVDDALRRVFAASMTESSNSEYCSGVSMLRTARCCSAAFLFMLVTSNFNAHDLGDIAFDAVAGVRVAVAVRHFDDERPLARELVFKYDRGAFRDQLGR